MPPRLSYEFYARPTLTVARDLLGQRLVRRIQGQRVAGLIVETEAYVGTDDQASHARFGPTERSRPMFGPPGHTYVYFIYGMHWLFNVVAHPHRPPGAVLVRALEPVEGLEVMRGLRGDKPRELLTNGPARLAQALDINGDLNDVDLCTHPALWIERGPGVPEAEVSTGPRVRVVGDESARARPWRFWIEGHPDLSS